MSYALTHDIAAQVSGKYALDETNLTAAGAGDNTEVNGLAIDIRPTSMANRPTSIAFLIWLRATLAQAATLAVEYTLQYSSDGTNFTDVPGKANIANAAVLTGGTGGSTEKGVLKVGLDLSRLPDSTTHVRIQVKPDLSAGATDTATVTAMAVFGGYQSLPAP